MIYFQVIITTEGVVEEAEDLILEDVFRPVGMRLKITLVILIDKTPEVEIIRRDFKAKGIRVGNISIKIILIDLATTKIIMVVEEVTIMIIPDMTVDREIEEDIIKIDQEEGIINNIKAEEETEDTINIDNLFSTTHQQRWS